MAESDRHTATRQGQVSREHFQQNVVKGKEGEVPTHQDTENVT